MCSAISQKTPTMSCAQSREDGGGVEGENRGAKRKISLLNCGVCGSDEAKYRCPGCLTHSCSLLCVKKHKDDSGCNGVRNKTAFVTLSHFDEMALLSDYRFLEDTGRFADGATRDNLIRCPHTTLKAKKLVNNARKMNITLRVLPVTFTKSRENSTIFLAKEKRFLWHLKLVFPQSSSEFTQRRVSDKLTLEQILTAYVHPAESDPVKRQKLKMYVRATTEAVKVFMKVEGGKANSLRYHELELTKSLRENLSYKILIEYPVLHIVLKDHWKEYQLKTPAEPAAACRGRATNSAAADREKTPRRPCTPGGVGVCARTQETRPEAEHTQEKKKKRVEDMKEDREEGEVTESSDEEEEEEEAEEVNTPCVKSCDEAERRGGVTEAADQSGGSVTLAQDVPNTRRDSGSDRRASENISGSCEDSSAAEVSAT